MAIFHRITDTYFTTATILRWQNLLENNELKLIITDALAYLVTQGHVRIYAFVIMPNHIHLVWNVIGAKSLGKIKHSLFSYTAHSFRKHLLAHEGSLDNYVVQKEDRLHQFWQSRSFDLPTTSQPFLLQKVNYIHQNPVKAGLVCDAGDYKHSSARSYRRGIPEWEFLTLYEVDFI